MTLTTASQIPGQRKRTPSVNIKVFGVGGGGSNAVTRMYRNRIPGIEYIVANTDAQALALAESSLRLRVGDRIAGAMGVGGNPDLGKACFEDDIDDIKEVLQGADLVFVAAGMGGGTGTGGAPVVARVAKQELGCLTVGVVTKPFPFEGAERHRQAQRGLNWLAAEVDTLIVVPNERLLLVADASMPIATAFRLADEILRQAMQSITELLILPGEINLDFADLRAVMKDAGPAWMAIGKGNGVNRADTAIAAVLSSPLLEVNIDGATGVLLNVAGGPDLMMAEVSKISHTIRQKVHPDAEIIFGTTQDFKMENEVKVTIIATGFKEIDTIPHYEDIRKQQEKVREERESKYRRHPLVEGLGVDMPDFIRERQVSSSETEDEETAEEEASSETADESEETAQSEESDQEDSGEGSESDGQVESKEEH